MRKSNSICLKFKNTLLIVFCTLSCFITYAQTEEELLNKLSNAKHDTDIIKIYINLYNTLLKTDITRTKSYAEQIVKYAKQCNNLNYEFIGYKALSNYEKRFRNYDTILHYDSLAMFVAKKINAPNVLYTAHMQIATDYADGDRYENVLPHLKICATIAMSQNNDSAMAKVENRLGWYFKMIHQNSKSFPHFEKALSAYEKLNDKKMIAHTKRGYAESLLEIGKTERVPEMLFEAIDYYQKVGSGYNLAHCLAVLSKAHLANGSFNMALQNYLEAKSLFKENKNTPDEGSATADIASFYLTARNFKKAKQYAIEAQAILQSINYEYGLIPMNTFWGQYYTLLHKLDSADYYFRKADHLAKENSIQDWETENLRYWAVLKYMQKNKQSGDSLLLKYTERIVKEREPAFIAYDIKKYIEENRITDTNIIKSLTLAYSVKGIQKLKDALAGIGSSTILGLDSTLISSYNIIPYTADSLKEKASYVKLLELETLYNTRIKDDSLKLQRQIDTLNKAKIKQNYIVIIATIILLLLVSFGFCLQYKYRKRAVKDRNEIFKLKEESHHRVDNQLGEINRLINIDGLEAADYNAMAKLKTYVSSIAFIHRHLAGDKNKSEIINFQSYVSDLCSAIGATYSSNKKIHFTIEAHMLVDQGMGGKLGLIINELVTNSIKHAFPEKEVGYISIRAFEEQKKLYLIVQDNGIGITTENNTDGHGIKTIEWLSNELKGKFSFSNINGTAFELVFQVPHQK